MAHVEASVEVEAAPETVWEFISDLKRVPEWDSFCDETLEVSAGAVGAGTVYRERGGVGPIKSVSEWRITEFEPPRRQVHEGDLGVMKPVLATALEPSERGTRMRQTVDFKMIPRVRPLELLLEALFVRRLMASGVLGTLANAKRMIEAERTTDA